MYKVLCFATFANSYAYKLTVPEAHFHADTIDASPAVIALKTAELFKCLYANSTRPYYSHVCMLQTNKAWGAHALQTMRQTFLIENAMNMFQRLPVK